MALLFFQWYYSPHSVREVLLHRNVFNSPWNHLSWEDCSPFQAHFISLSPLSGLVRSPPTSALRPGRRRLDLLFTEEEACLFTVHKMFSAASLERRKLRLGSARLRSELLRRQQWEEASFVFPARLFWEVLLINAINTEREVPQCLWCRRASLLSARMRLNGLCRCRSSRQSVARLGLDAVYRRISPGLAGVLQKAKGKRPQWESDQRFKQQLQQT